MLQQCIVYRVLDSPLGRLIAGSTARGCCLLEFEDRDGLSGIQPGIEKRYGLPMASGSSPFLQQLEGELEQYFRGARRRFAVPLDIQGTPFQQRVWRELLTIPYGETRTYGAIAKRIGQPSAVRAVGGANGRNALAIVIPCHRIIQAGGQLSGYGGGVWRKKYLLDLESRFADGPGNRPLPL